ncbi:MAG TPA: hypothetical protein VFY51_05845, partial [Pyrinomonadaceae bacterium]|nr:hypothetical protein [Pyrinomonadaceae bacterium]
RYAILLAILVVLLIVEPRWFWMAFALWLLMLIARAVVAIWRNRKCYPSSSFFHNLRRAIVVIAILAVLDGAAIIGWFQWLFLDAFRSTRKTPVEDG